RNATAASAATAAEVAAIATGIETGIATATGTGIAAGSATVIRSGLAPDPLPGTAVKQEHQLTTLDSGVRIVTERMPSVRSVSLGFWIGTGSRNESDGEAGLSHMLEH